MLVTAIGYVAEAAYHHPDLAVTWGRVIVKLKNHAAGGVTDKDFELAKKIEETVLWRSPPGGGLEGAPHKIVRAGGPRGRPRGGVCAPPHAAGARGRAPPPRGRPAFARQGAPLG